MEIDDKVNHKSTPVTKPLLHKDKDADSRVRSWNYRSAIGMLNYLQASTRPDIAMAVHQCARFSNDPKITHERAVMRIGKYLLGTKDRGVKFIPDKSLGIECFVDADLQVVGIKLMQETLKMSYLGQDISSESLGALFYIVQNYKLK